MVMLLKMELQVDISEVFPEAGGDVLASRGVLDFHGPRV
jgi:hypothetical protein